MKQRRWSGAGVGGFQRWRNQATVLLVWGQRWCTVRDVDVRCDRPVHDVVKVLIQEWPSLTERRDSYSNTPLHYAASLGNLGMVCIFLQSNISANYIMDEDGRTPFLVAAKNGHVGVIMEILQFCPDSAEVADKKGRNVLHVAVKSEKLEVIRYILKLCDHKELINEPDNEGNTPLHLAIIKRHISVLNLLLKDKKVDTRAMNNNGMTALDIAESDKELTMKFRKGVFKENCETWS